MFTTSSEKLKNIATVIEELTECYGETLNALKHTIKGMSSAENLWKQRKTSRLIKYGLTLVAIPDPFIVTDVAGACMVSVGLIQTKIRNSSLHVEDIYTTFQNVIKDMLEIKAAFTR